MLNIPTPHIEANFGDIAQKVLMPGDPLRAKFIAENYLSDVICYNQVRNMLGFTGIYKGEKVSVQGSGMGMPSIGIYSFELFNFYKAEQIIRVGTAGAVRDDVKLKDIIIATGACTNSNYGNQYGLPGKFSPIADFLLANKAYETAKNLNFNVKCGNVLSSDVFYSDVNELAVWGKMGVLAVEMEAAALYMNASHAGKKALCLLTISDIPLKGETTTSHERQSTFTDMIEIALNI